MNVIKMKSSIITLLKSSLILLIPFSFTRWITTSSITYNETNVENYSDDKSSTTSSRSLQGINNDEHSRTRINLYPELRTTSSSRTEAYKILLFGGSIQKLNEMQIDGFEEIMEEFAKHFADDNTNVGTYCEIISQSPIRRRNNRPRTISTSGLRRRNRHKTQQRQNQKRQLIDDETHSHLSLLGGENPGIEQHPPLIIANRDHEYKSRNLVECDTASNTASLTIYFNIEWSISTLTDNENNLLECYLIDYINWMNSQDGKDALVQELNNYDVCVNHEKGFNGTSTDFVCNIANETFVPTISTITPTTTTIINATTSYMPTTTPTMFNITDEPHSSSPTMIYTMTYTTVSNNSNYTHYMVDIDYVNRWTRNPKIRSLLTLDSVKPSSMPSSKPSILPSDHSDSSDDYNLTSSISFTLDPTNDNNQTAFPTINPTSEVTQNSTYSQTFPGSFSGSFSLIIISFIPSIVKDIIIARQRLLNFLC